MKSKNIYWILSLVVVIVTFGMIAIHWKDLPEQVAMHFNLQGEANRYGNKSELFVLPTISSIILVLFYWINKNGIKLNPQKLGAKTPMQLKITKSFTAQMALFASMLLGYATYSIMAISLGKKVSLGNTFIFITFLGLFLLIVSYFWQINRADDSQ